MKQISRFLTTLAMLMLAAVPAAHARPQRDTDGTNILGSGRGSLKTLDQALHMAAVQVAMRAFDARGYQRMPDYDYGSSVGDTAIALLAYQMPGVDPGLKQPIITVITRAINGAPLTDVRGGLIERVNGSVRGVTDPLNPPLHVSIGDMNSTAASNYSVEGDPLTEQQWASWLLCSFTTCITCAGANFWPVLGQVVCCVITAIICHKAIVY